MRCIRCRGFVVLALLGPLAPLAAQDYPTLILEDEPLAYYRFEEAPDELPRDSSGNGFDAIGQTNATLGVEGLVGGAVSFVGDGNVVLGFNLDPADPEGDGSGVGLDDFSIELFVRTESEVSNQVFLAQQDGAGLGRSDLLVTANGFIGSFLGGGTTNSSVDPPPGAWHHLVLTYDGGLGAETIRLYVNGELAGSSGLVAEAATGDWVVGSHKNLGVQFFTGLVDELSFFDYRIDDPDGDDETDDSRIPAHFEAAFGDSRPCNALNTSCRVEQELVVVDALLEPEDCDCDDLDVLIDGVFIENVPVPTGGELIEVALPEDCFPDTEHTITLRCTNDGRSGSCTFICPPNPCATLDPSVRVEDGLEVSFTPLELDCNCDSLEVSIDGELVTTVDADAGLITLDLPEDCVSGSEHSLELACRPDGPVETLRFLCPIESVDDYVALVLSHDPLAYYRFEEEAGETVVIDESQNEYDSLDVGTSILGEAGLLGRGVVFDGASSLELGVELDPSDSEGDGIGVGLDDFSVECFLKTSSEGSEQVFISQQDGGGLGRSNVLVTANNTLGSFMGGGTTDSSVTPELDRWYHVVMTYDGGLGAETIRIYVDGELVGTSGRVAESAFGSWIVGSHKSRASQFFTGAIDELSFYDYRLDDPDGDDEVADSRVRSHFEAVFGSQPECENLAMTCGTSETELFIEVEVLPLGCDCSALELTIDGVPAGTVDRPLNGQIVTPLPPGCPPGRHTLEVLCTASGLAGTCEFVCGGSGEGGFVRGDADASGAINITDGIFLLNFLFLGGAGPSCDDAGDANDDGGINITDGIFLLNFLFLGGQAPPAPHPACGSEAEGDALDCAGFAACP